MPKREIEILMMDEFRTFRQIAANWVEDCDIILTGRVPDDCPEEMMLRLFNATRSFVDSGATAGIHMLLMMAMVSFNQEGMIARAERDAARAFRPPQERED